MLQFFENSRPVVDHNFFQKKVSGQLRLEPEVLLVLVTSPIQMSIAVVTTTLSLDIDVEGQQLSGIVDYVLIPAAEQAPITVLQFNARSLRTHDLSFMRQHPLSNITLFLVTRGACRIYQ